MCVCAINIVIIIILKNLHSYANMDYIFWLALRGNIAKCVVVSYDIACSWHKNLISRRESLPSHVISEPTPSPGDFAPISNAATSHPQACSVDDSAITVTTPVLPKLEFVIPKGHILGHGTKCQDKFSLNFRRNMARTDGENIERGWAWMNPASLSTREMGPGARHDTLDNQWSYWNWRILVQLGGPLSTEPTL